MSYLDLLVIIDPGSARTAQAVIWKLRKKKTKRTQSAFQLYLKKDADNEVFSLYLARDDISTIWSEGRRHLLEIPAAKEVVIQARLGFFQWFWRANFPPRRLMTNKPRALTSAARAELAKLNPLLSPPNCLDLGANREKRLFWLLQSVPKENRDWQETRFARYSGKAGVGNEHTGFGRATLLGNVSVHIYRSFGASPAFFCLSTLKLGATAHLQQVWRGQGTEAVSGEKDSLQKRQDTRN